MASSSRKRPRVTLIEDSPSTGGGGGGGLYDFLPEPDPEHDAAAKIAAEKKAVAPLPAEDRSRVVFLDIDGVLLAAGSVETIVVDGCPIPIRARMNETEFSAKAIGCLRTIIEKTGATIVLSSEWRRTAAMKDSVGSALRSKGLPQLRDSTVILKAREELMKGDTAIAWCERRARECAQWLRAHPEVTAYVLLDDLDFSWADSVKQAGTPVMKCRSVHTNAVHCLSDEDAAKAVEILLKPPVLTDDEAAAAVAEAVHLTQRALAECGQLMKHG